MTSTRLENEGRALVERLGGHWSGRGGLCRCPAHTDRTPSLSVRIGQTRLLFHCFAGCSRSAVIEALLAMRHLTPALASDDTVADEAGRRSSRDAALRLWHASRPIGGTEAERYLASRALLADLACLRFHPRAPFGRSPLTVFAPALIAAVEDESDVVAVHRTRLNVPVSHQAGSPPRKAALGSLGNGAVRLARPGPTLALAEGIEDALSVTAMTGIPCWATLGAARFGRIALPVNTRALVLFLDHDGGGRKAESLARAAYGQCLTVEARYPATPGTDWNDLLRNRPAVFVERERGGGGLEAKPARQ